jgi:F0F1-type ATP synthase membrane subunit a
MPTDTLGLVLLLVFVVTKKGGGKSVPNALQSLVELIYDFVPNLVNEQIGGLSEINPSLVKLTVISVPIAH